MFFHGYNFKLKEDFKGNEPNGCQFKLYSQADVVLPDFLSGIMCPHRVLIPTGVEFEVQEGNCVSVYGRNGLASIHGIFLMSNVILTPESYGELKVVVCNLGDKDFTIKAGDVIANGVVLKTS